MIITKIEPVTKVKFKVYLDEQFAFVLYKGELSRYRLQEDCELSQETFEQIKREVLLKRAKLRAMHLLNQMDRTTQQLRLRLERDLYPKDIVEQAIDYVASFGYIGDEEYAKRFIASKQNLKSKKEIILLLYQKGISKDIVQKAVDSCYQEEDEITAITRIVEKKRFQIEGATDKEKKKIYDYLLRKGFSYEGVRQVIQVSSWNA